MSVDQREGDLRSFAESLSQEERENHLEKLLLECDASLSSILKIYPGAKVVFKEMLQTIRSGEMRAYQVQGLLESIFLMAPAEVIQKLQQTAEFLELDVELTKKQK